MFAHELAAAFEAFRRHGFPESPDRALMPRGERVGPSAWASMLTPREAARMARAVELGGRGSFVWTERDNSL